MVDSNRQSSLRRVAKRAVRRVGGRLLFGRPSAAVLNKAMPVEWIGSHLAELLDDLKINCVFDVGANVGQYALMLRDVGYRGRIVSFEPVRANVEELQRWARRDPNWIIAPVALGRAEREQEINVSRWTVFSSLLELSDRGERFGDGGRLDHREIVQVKRLDAMTARLFEGLREPRVFLKLDTQGYDLEVLEGASGVLGSILALQSEISTEPTYVDEPGFFESLDQFMSLGFSLTGMYPVSRDPQLRVNCFDAVMRRSVDRPLAAMELSRIGERGRSQNNQSSPVRHRD